MFLLPSPLPSSATVFAMLALVGAFAGALLYARPSAGSLAAGLGLIVLGIGIRLLTNATLVKNETLAARGLYAVCRHPMYVGTLLAAAGVALALNHPAALGLPVVVLAISLWRMRKEESFLLVRLPGYAAYRKEVPSFPTLHSMARALANGRWRQPLSLERCFMNGEVLRLNLYLLLLAAAGFYLQQPAGLVGAGAVATLAAAGASFRWHPAGARRSRNDYLLPAVLGAAILALVIGA